MTRHRYSTAYLAALERRLGADTFGPSAARSEGARLLAQLGGPETERGWAMNRALSESDKAAESVLDDLLDRQLAVASRVSDARRLSNEEPGPTGLDPLVDICRAEAALDHAVRTAPLYYRRDVEQVLAVVQRLVLEVAGHLAGEEIEEPPELAVAGGAA